MTHAKTTRIPSAALALALALGATSCQDSPQSTAKDGDATTVSGAAPRDLAVKIVPDKDTASSYALLVNPKGNESAMYLCTNDAFTACTVGRDGVLPMRSVESGALRKFYVSSKGFTLTPGKNIHVFSTDASGNVLDKRSLRAVDAPKTLKFDLPQERRVFQRSSKEKGKVWIRFTLTNRDAKYARVRLSGSSKFASSAPLGVWKEITLNPDASGLIQESVEAPAGGWYQLDVLLLDQTRARVLDGGRVAKVGVGEVFLVAGQSNSTNCGERPQKNDNDLIATTDGATWRQGSDPQLGTHDSHLCSDTAGSGGSNWPVTADILQKKLEVPVAIASTGYSGTAIAQWLPEATTSPGGDARTLFKYTTDRASQLGDFRAVLWHQGENDSYAKTTTAAYEEALTKVITGLRDKVKRPVPWLVAEASYCNKDGYKSAGWPKDWGPSEAVIAAQRKLVTDKKVPDVYSGPYTDKVGDDMRVKSGAMQTCHFTEAGLKEVGRMWAEKITAFLDAQYAAGK